MTINRLRRQGMPRALALAVLALLCSAPSYAVAGEAPGSPRLQSLEEAVAALPESADVTMTDKVVAVEQAFDSIGQGEASYYGRELQGNRTASGQRFDAEGFTAAHRTLPLGTKLRVTNLANGLSVIVTVNDRGPFVHSRLIDVSLGAAREINMVRSGRAQVKLEVLRTIA
jgi:rare lipoprotein A